MINVVMASPNFALSFAPFFLYKPNITFDIIYSLEDLDKISNANLVIFPGGEDISPEIYHQDNLYSHYNSPGRDELEIEVFNRTIKLNKKILGVCRGHQLINALLGGDLIQDIEIELNEIHRGFHNLEFINTRSLAYRFFADGVNSLHHQGVKRNFFGNGLIPTAYFGGVIEMCESKNIITTQFHPEFMNTRGFFNYLVKWSE